MGSKLAELCAGTERLSLETAGQVAYDGFRAPLWVVRFQPLEIRKRILITGGVHGNEPAGAAWMVELITLLAENPELYPYCAFDLVPVVNPWGWSRDIRFNKDGRDINRDFASFETQEAQIMRQVFESAEYDLVIDHHEDPDACGFYLYQYAKRDQSVSREVISKIRDLGYPIEQDVHMVILHTKDGLIDAPRWGLMYMRLTRQLSITNYLKLKHSDLVYTIETPTVVAMRDRLRMHRLAFETIIENLPD